MVDENICKICTDKNCRHAGQPTTRERLDMYDKERRDKACPLQSGSYPGPDEI
jgi:hypothetical protein